MQGTPAGAQKDLYRPNNPSESEINRPVADKWALVVGISHFADSSIPALRYAAKDAQDFASFLIKEQNFAPDHVRVLLNENATQREILSELGNKFLPRVVKPDDLVVLFYSSHGSPAGKDIRNENFLVAYDTDKTDLWATAIPMQELTRILRERVLANRILIIMDACHSGGGADGAKAAEQGANFKLNELDLGDGQLVVSSSSEEQRSWESKRCQNGVFTYRLMESMRRYPQLSEALKHAEQAVMDEVQEDQAMVQTPIMNKSKWRGNDLVLGAVPLAPRTFPQSVQQLLEQKKVQAQTPELVSTVALTIPSTIPPVTNPHAGGPNTASTSHSPAPNAASTSHSPAAFEPFDLNGTWVGQLSNGTERTFLHINHVGAAVQAVKISKGKYVPKGQISFEGQYTGRTFSGRAQSADEGYQNPRWETIHITVPDANTIQVVGTREYASTSFKRTDEIPPPDKPARPDTLTGEWYGSSGTMGIEQNGASVIMTTPADGTRYTGTFDGTTIYGQWDSRPTYNMAGTFQMKYDREKDSLSGWYQTDWLNGPVSGEKEKRNFYADRVKE